MTTQPIDPSSQENAATTTTDAAPPDDKPADRLNEAVHPIEGSEQPVSPTDESQAAKFIAGIAALPLGQAPPTYAYGPPPDDTVAALDIASYLWVQYKKARGKAKEDAFAQFTAASKRADQVAPSYWFSETEQAYVAVDFTGQPTNSPPAHWPPVMWLVAVEIWTQVDGLYSIAARYLDPDARFYLNYELARIQGELLTLLDQTSTPGVTVAEPLTRARARLESARADLQMAATNKATYRYLVGMVRGLVCTAPIALLIGVLVGSVLPWTVDLVNGATACAIAGQFGALVSVLTRVSGGGLNIDYRAGDRMLSIVGFARPVLGAILASAVYFATVGGVVPLTAPDDVTARFAFFVTIGFIAGFSERYAQDMLSISPTAQQKP